MKDNSDPQKIGEWLLQRRAENPERSITFYADILHREFSPGGPTYYELEVDPPRTLQTPARIDGEDAT